jgi:DNA mismatch repair protein MutS2
MFSLKGVLDLRPALEAASGGYVLTARQLEGVGSTLEAAFEAKCIACSPLPKIHKEGLSESVGTKEILTETSPKFKFPELASLSQPIDDGDIPTLRAIKDCIQVGIRITNLCSCQPFF